MTSTAIDDNMVEPDSMADAASKTRKPGDLKPCERCRSQHLKCVYDSETCRRCERVGVECVRNTKKIRFRGVQISKLRGDRKKPAQNGSKANQNPSEATKRKFQAGNQSGGESKHIHIIEDDEPVEVITANAQLPSALAWQEPVSVDNGTNNTYFNSDTSSHVFTTPDKFMGNEKLQSEFASPPKRSISSNLYDSNGSTSLAQTIHPLSRVLSNDGLPTTPTFSPSQRSSIRSAPSGLLDQLVKYPVKGCNNTSLDYLETVLLRYFREELAPWFDLCDPDCHFAWVVPYKIREPGPLRSAILTISARNLSRNARFRNAAGVVEWAGRPLPELREELAMTYHNDCIRDLLQLSMDPKKLHDDTLLAAVIALRTDEELSLDMLEEEEDQQLFLRIASVFIDAQVPPSICLPHSSPEVFPSMFEDKPGSRPGSQGDVSFHVSPRLRQYAPSPSNQTDTDLGASGLRQACFWTAFRQELHASFLRQQPVRFPLARCEAFRQLTPAIDAVWANRMVTFCADVLEFCYGSSCSDGKVAPAYTNQERWVELRTYERNMCAMLPASFEPTYCNESGATQGITMFPEIWYLEACHVSGTTYVELARMLLEAFNPTRPKLGHGFLAATNAFVASTKRILFRLCGIALSNHRFCAPSLINACLGISMFGEYFEDPAEQDALLGVLSLMSSRHAYPTHQIATALRRAWNSEDTISAAT